MQRKIILSIFALLFIGFSYSEVTKEEGVLVLNDQNFDEEL
jgi:hypothetical protein